MRLKPFAATLIIVWSLAVVYFYSLTHPLPPFSGVFLKEFLRGPTLSAFFQSLGRGLSEGLWIGVIILLGQTFWSRLHLAAEGVMEECLLSAGLGAGILMIGLLALGFLGLWIPTLLRGLAALGGIALLVANRRWLSQILHRPAGPTSGAPWTAWERCLAAAGGIFLGVYGIGALSPEISYDSLVYHLAIPQLWLLHHRIIPTPDCCFSGIPFNVELLYGLALALADEGAAKLLHFACGCGTLGVLYLLAKRRGSRGAGLSACLLFLSPPMMALEFGRSSVDLGSAFLASLAALALWRGIESSSREQSRWTLLSGIFCGLAMGTKYLAWILLPALVIALWVSDQSRERGRILRLMRLQGCLVIPALLLVLPWLAKNAVFFRNPVYPFFLNAFHSSGSLSNWEGLRGEAARPLTDLLSWKGLARYVVDPWVVTMSGKSDHNFIGPLYLLFLPWLMFLRGSGPRMRPLIHVLAVLWVLSSLGTFLPRFWMLALLVLCVPLGTALTEAPGRLTYWTRGLLMIGLLSNWTWGASFILDSEGWKVVWGRIDKAHYLNTSHRSYNAPYFDAAEFINTQLPPDAGVLVLGDFRSFYLRRRFWAASAYNTPPMFALANASAGGEELYARLRARGITHILFNAAAVVPGSHYWEVTLTPQGRTAFHEFWESHTHELFQEQNLRPGDVQAVFVYELIDHHRPPERPEPDRLLQILDALAGKS